MGSLAPPLLCPRLIGREAELEALGAAIDDATRGRGRTLLIAGEAGIGKTALIRRGAEVARARGARVALGECVELEAQRSLRPFMEIVASLERQSLLRGVTRPPDHVEAIDEASRHRLYGSFVLLLAQIGRRAPIVAVVEDLHWADDVSLQLFPYLARALRDERVVLVGTYRSDEIHRRHPLRPVLAELSRARVATEVVVPRMDPSTVGMFVRETLGNEPSAALIEAVAHRCDGNPFFVEELLKALEHDGQLVHRDGRWQAGGDVRGAVIPDSVRDAVLGRFDRLAPEARRALNVAAVVGQTFDVEIVAAVVGSTDDLSTHLRSALHAQLIRPERPDGRRFAFRHALTREALLAELLTPERRPIHAAVALAIEGSKKDPAARSEELAYHFDEAGDHDRAHRFHITAAEAAFQAAAFPSAARHFERALEIAPASADVAQLYIRLAESDSLAGNIARALRASEAAWRVFTATGRQLEAGDALRRVARGQFELRDPASFATGCEALRLLEPLGPTPELAWACADMARQHMIRREVAGVREWAQRALDLATSIGYTKPIADARISLAYAVDHDGDADLAMRMLRQSIEDAIREGLTGTASRGYNNLNTWYLTYLTGERRALFEEWRAFTERTGYRPATISAEEARWALADGDLDRVLRIASESTGAEDPWSLGALMKGALARTARDGPEAARSDVESVLAAIGSRPTWWARALAVEWYDFVGEPARGVREAAHVDDPATGVERPLLMIHALHAAHAAADPSAYERWRLVAEELRHDQLTIARYGSTYVDAEDAAARDEPAVAASLFGNLADVLDDVQLPAMSTLIRLRRIEMLIGHDPRTAQAELKRIVTFWRRCGALWYLEQLRHWAAERGLRFPQAHGPSGKSLTTRELEVARFVSAGLSNREIAERLVISERTAEGHVQHIMEKLSFKSRAQVAAWHVAEAHVAR